jgi:glyoxylase-like metal-dependent hydrolase (beta-lactamase superfamily II)
MTVPPAPDEKLEQRGLVYPHGHHVPESGRLLQVAEGIFWLRMPLPFSLDHINLWVLDGGDHWAIVDTGFPLPEAKMRWSALFEGPLAGKPVGRVIVTHYHPDHIGLAGWLAAEKSAPLWISQGDYLTSRMIYEDVGPFSVARMVALFCQHGLAESAATAFVQRGNAYKTGIWPHPLAYRQLFAGDPLKIGDHTWRTIVGYGHAAEHMSLYCDELRVLISGDMLLPRISTNIAVQAVNPDGDPLRLFLASIDAFLALPADTLVLPAHGRPFRGIHDRVAQLHAHHVERCNVLLNACKGKAASAAELIPVLFERELDDIHQTMFAMGEAIAHLNYLWHAGRLRRTEKNGVLHFSS